MKPISPECARSDMKCKNCSLLVCGCGCHKNKTLAGIKADENIRKSKTLRSKND